MSSPSLSLHVGFLSAFAKLPKPQQRKAQKLFEKFRQDSKAAALNLEKIQGSKDPQIRTIRVDKAWRAVVLAPEVGNTYVLLWVDHHDDAIDWAKKHRAEVHERTGAFQVYSAPVEVRDGGTSSPEKEERETSSKAPEPSRPEPAPAAKPLFDYSDDVLLDLGVPRPHLGAVQALTTEAALDALGSKLPEDAFETLIGLQAGLPLAEIQEELAARKKEAERLRAGAEGLEAALAHPDSQRTLVRIDSDEALEAILAAPLERWRVFLHPTQRRLVERESKGPMRVLGGAGTGKTVVALHRARYLARHVLAEGESLLVTTFTRNLAQSLAESLDQITGDEMQMIEVQHLHAWAVRFLAGQGVRVQVANSAESERAWRTATSQFDEDELEFGLGFYRSEWIEVLQAQGIETTRDYLRARRRGRGTRLGKAQRKHVLEVCLRYREVLREMGRWEWVEVVREARRLLEARPERPYRAVVIDEAQDFHEEEWKLIRALAPEAANDLTLVGDVHQRIYGHPIRLTHLGINIRGRRSTRLKLNYRTTEEIRNFAHGLLEGRRLEDLDGEEVPEVGERSLMHGPRPEIRSYPDRSQETEAVLETVRSWLDQGVSPRAICLATRRSQERDALARALEQAGLAVQVLGGKASEQDPHGVCVSTLHRIKGLEFLRVLLARVDLDAIPEHADLEDALAEEQARTQERCLLYVAASRARDQLVLTRVEG